MNSTLKRIVITGGSCAGKTTGLLRVQERLANLRWNPVIVPEAATIVFKGAGRPNSTDRERVLKYQKALIQAQLYLEDVFESLADGPRSVMLTDRGAAGRPRHQPH